MKKLTKTDVEGLLVAAFSEGRVRVHKKSGRFLARRAAAGEMVLTIVAGKLETLKTTENGDVVVRNIVPGSSAETYIIDVEKYEDRYKESGYFHRVDGETWREVYANGEIEAFEYEGDTIGFVAPWGEIMICEDGDFIGRTPGSGFDDIYRIERNAFMEAYGPPVGSAQCATN